MHINFIANLTSTDNARFFHCSPGVAVTIRSSTDNTTCQKQYIETNRRWEYLGDTSHKSVWKGYI